MKKKLFQNYQYEFDSNQKKVLTNFAKQAVKQMESDDRYVKEVKTFNSVIDKLNSADEVTKFTKDEKIKLVFQLKENVKHLQKKIDDSWFLTKWFYKSMLNQYNNLLLIFDN